MDQETRMQQDPQPESDEAWYALADEEACSVLAKLPDDIRAQISELSVTLDPFPSPDEELEEGDDEALLGLFVGPSFAEALETADPQPCAIRLFVENLRDEAEDDPARFRQEVRTTLLHEIGHYLGLDEDGLAERGLA